MLLETQRLQATPKPQATTKKAAKTAAPKPAAKLHPSPPAPVQAGPTKPVKPLKPLPPLWSVVVRGKAGDSAKAVREKIAETVNSSSDAQLASIRFKGVHETSDGVVIRTCSLVERQQLTECAALKSVGLETAVPTPRRPRAVIRHVPKTLSTNELAEQIYARNLGSLLSREQFEAEFRVCSRNMDLEHAHVVVETSQQIHEALLAERRVYIGFEALTVRNLEGVRMCFRCRSHDHIARHCPVAAACCYRCGREGHMSKDCRNAAECRSCREKNFPHNHQAASSACKTYERAH